MRSILAALALLIASAPAVEILGADLPHAGCGAAPAQAAPGAGGDPHAAHRAAAPAPVTSAPVGDGCECGCDCGPGHGCTATAVAAPALSATILPINDVRAPAAARDPLASRVDPPLYRPPITRSGF